MKLQKAKVEYRLEREEATLARLTRQHAAGRPASASAIAKWCADMERMVAELPALQIAFDESEQRVERAAVALEACERALAAATEVSEEANTKASAAAKKEMDVQELVASKLQSLVASGLVFTSARAENEFKSLLFRKILDGALGSRCNYTSKPPVACDLWVYFESLLVKTGSKEDEGRFQELFCGDHLKGPTSAAGLNFKKIRA